jgi:hypothetical protein
MGLIPGGQSFVLQPDVGPTYDWVANVEHGTSIIFVMVDSAGREGGSSDINIVGTTDDSTCLNGSSPSSTVSPTPTPTSGTSGTSVSSGVPSQTGAPGEKVSVAAVIGAIIGIMILTAAAVTLVIFYIRRRRRGPGLLGNSRPSRYNSRRTESNIDLNDSSGSLPITDHYRVNDTQTGRTPATASHLLPAGQYEPDPFTLPPPSHPASRYSAFSAGEGSNGGTSEQMSSAQRKAAMSGATAYKPARFILHTDVEEAVPPAEDELIELPPQYSASRAPLPGLHTQPPSNPPYPYPRAPPIQYPQ